MEHFSTEVKTTENGRCVTVVRALIWGFISNILASKWYFLTQRNAKVNAEASKGKK